MRVFVELWSFSTSHLLNSGTKDIPYNGCLVYPMDVFCLGLVYEKVNIKINLSLHKQI